MNLPQRIVLVDSRKIIACHGNSPKAASFGAFPRGNPDYLKLNYAFTI